LEGGGARGYEQLTATSDSNWSWRARLLGGELPTCGARLTAAISAHGYGEARRTELIGDLLNPLRRGLLPRGMRDSIHGDQVHVRATAAQ